MMKTLKYLIAAAALNSILLAGPVFASPQARTYQVTGPVLEITDTYIAVKKGEETWQVARDGGTKISGDLKVGSKVTIEYRMIATGVEVKDNKAGKAEKAKKSGTP